MNRSATTFAVTLAALAAAAPAQAADGGSALRYSARAEVTLKSSLDLARDGDAARGRLMRALKTAHALEVKAATAARHKLNAGRQTSAAAVKNVGRVLVRLDAAGRTELAVLRATGDKRVQRKAADGVDLNARLTSKLNVDLARSAGEGGAGAQGAAATVVEQRSHRVTGTVRQIVRTRPSVRSEDARAKLDHAVAVFIEANRRTSEKLSEPPAGGDDSAQPARESALDATVQSSTDIAAAINGSESQDAQVSGSANGSAGSSGSTTLGELASASSNANSALAARARR
jgi:hypothetical protein